MSKSIYHRLCIRPVRFSIEFTARKDKSEIYIPNSKFSDCHSFRAVGSSELSQSLTAVHATYRSLYCKYL